MTKNILKIFIIICLTIENLIQLRAQDIEKGSNIYISPRITLGYTFGTGLNYGFDVMIGLYKVKDFNFGINFTYYMVNTDQGHHRIKGMGVFGEMKYLSIKLDAGAVSRRWGLKNVNKASAPGLLVDFSAGIGEDTAPWVGVKSFIFDHNRWVFYDKPSYISGYTYFKSPNIVVFEEKPVPDPNP